MRTRGYCSSTPTGSDRGAKGSVPSAWRCVVQKTARASATAVTLRTSRSLSGRKEFRRATAVQRPAMIAEGPQRPGKHEGLVAAVVSALCREVGMEAPA